jgi:hypothetical protein
MSSIYEAKRREMEQTEVSFIHHRRVTSSIYLSICIAYSSATSGHGKKLFNGVSCLERAASGRTSASASALGLDFGWFWLVLSFA